MKSLLIISLLTFLSTTSALAAWNDNLRGDNRSLNGSPKNNYYKSQNDSNLFIGVSTNSFALNGSDVTAKNLNTNQTATAPGKSKDKGTAVGFTLGVFLNRTKRINLFYFTGEEKNTSAFTVTATSISLDHSFNGSGVHRGWFLGGGVTKIDLENIAISGLTASTSSGTGLLVRGGYEYKFDNQLFLDVGFNVHLTDINHKIRGTGANSNIEISTKFDVSNAYLSLNYAF